jgi:hypothetical protein
MPLYTQNNTQLQEIKEKPFRLEKDIQKLFEANLTDIMGLEMVKSEFTIKNKRIDTLAFDAQSKACVIVRLCKKWPYCYVPYLVCLILKHQNLIIYGL